MAFAVLPHRRPAAPPSCRTAVLPHRRPAALPRCRAALTRRLVAPLRRAGLPR
ncbi:hypothetical protein ACFWF7_05730 [Nocardia sp. NPDC060256]|uniref:hypothetical protein n=1 Tax=unclassified Nocardia TaxID=2637762 RepID=UPI00365693D9